jgi:hypothetical protein
MVMGGLIICVLTLLLEIFEHGEMEASFQFYSATFHKSFLQHAVCPQSLVVGFKRFQKTGIFPKNDIKEQG